MPSNQRIDDDILQNHRCAESPSVIFVRVRRDIYKIDWLVIIFWSVGIAADWDVSINTLISVSFFFFKYSAFFRLSRPIEKAFPIPIWLLGLRSHRLPTEFPNL